MLLIISDDLRPDLMEAYGQSAVLTPHFDRLAKKAAVFNRAYCQQAICGPSRNSFLSGRRPQRTQSWQAHSPQRLTRRDCHYATRALTSLADW